VVSTSGPDFGARLGAAVEEAWELADEVAPELLAGVADQIAAGHEAYARFGAALNGRPRRA
jgi:hypothetical protein